jgi:hypothetical protein
MIMSLMFECIVTPDDRQLQLFHTADDRLFIEVESAHGNVETIILDKDEVRRVQLFLIEKFGEVYD